MTLFDLEPLPIEEPGLSAGQRLTLRNRAQLDAGRHPATRGELRPELGTCGGCCHHLALQRNVRTYHKCDCHRLGVSHGAASDIRISWPACELFEATQ